MSYQRSTIDVETLLGCFTITFLDYDSDNYEQYVISERINQIQEIKEKLKRVNYFIGFNNIHFDSIICNWLINQKETTPEKIYNVAQTVIEQDDNYNKYRQYSKYKYNSPWINVDLFMYWSKMLRLSKKMSLKYFAVNLDMVVQEMPMSHSKKEFKPYEILEVLSYNYNDCLVTKALAKKLNEQINLRVGIKQTYNLDAISWDAPKIASELLLDSYCKLTFEKEFANGETPADYTNFYDYKKTIRNTKPDGYDFINKEYLPKIEFKTKEFQDLYIEICNSKNGFEKEIIHKKFNGSRVKISYGSGGIHTVHKNEEYLSNSKSTLWTSDVSSLYPTLLENYKFINPKIHEVLDIYSQKKKERIEAKRNKWTVINETLKLVLNSTTGLLDNSYSWLYSPGPIMGLRLTGQLILTRLLEECNLSSFSVISMNTDGAEVIIPVGKEKAYLQVIKTIEKEFNIEFEHDQYKSIRYKTVNDYIAITTSNKIKVKGEFLYEKEIDKSNEFLIIPIAVKEYFVNNIPVEITINNHKNIFNFCAAKKIDKKYKVYHMETQQQQLNRFYVSKKGGYLYKKKEGKNTLEHVFKESGIQIINNIPEEFPTDIDNQFYIKSARNIIKLFEKEQISLF